MCVLVKVWREVVWRRDTRGWSEVAWEVAVALGIGVAVMGAVVALTVAGWFLFGG